MGLDVLRWLWLAWCALPLLVVAAEEYCFSHDTDPYPYFSTKTGYEVVRNKRVRYGSVPNCEPVLVWGLFRHGTRYPGKDEIKRESDMRSLRDSILRNHNVEPKSGRLCYDDLELLRDWTYNVTESDAELLTSEGVSDLYLLAKRLKTYFPPLDATYSPDRFKIAFTELVRTKQSADAFTRGLFGEEINLPESYINEPLLEPYNNCSGWANSTRNEGAERQIRNFREGPLMKELIHSVSRRLGFNYDLTYDAIKDMYDMCRYDKAWHPRNQSPWCVAFTKENLRVMEYNEDLSYYYETGYGNPFTGMLGCPLVADLMNTLHQRTMANNSDEIGPPVTLYFAHSTTLRALLVRLGMAHDQMPLTADNYQAEGRREWKTSIISPFAGNLVVVLYKCSDQFKVMFYLNEHYVDYRGCDVGLCNWTYIYERFAPTLNPSTCNLNFCRTSAGTNFTPGWLLPSLLLIYFAKKLNSS